MMNRPTARLITALILNSPTEVNYAAMDDVDRATSGIPLPRDVREGLIAHA